MSSSDQKLSSTGDDSSANYTLTLALGDGDDGPYYSEAYPIDPIEPHELLFLHQSTLRLVPEGDEPGGVKLEDYEPEWHRALARALSVRSGTYPDKEGVKDAIDEADDCLRVATQAIRNLPEGTNLDAVRASLIAHMAAAAGRAGTYIIDSPISAGCAYCLKHRSE